MRLSVGLTGSVEQRWAQLEEAVLAVAGPGGKVSASWAGLGGAAWRSALVTHSLGGLQGPAMHGRAPSLGGSLAGDAQFASLGGRGAFRET